MQTTDINRIKVTISDQAFFGKSEGNVSYGAGGRCEAKKGPDSGDDTRLGQVVPKDMLRGEHVVSVVSESP